MRKKTPEEESAEEEMDVEVVKYKKRRSYSQKKQEVAAN